MQVLIVDSSLLIIERLQEMLAETVSTVAASGATSYTDGKNAFYKINPAVVLLDMNLPGNDSFKLLTEIKNCDSGTLVIALSIHTDEEMQERCKLLGADFFFDKYYTYEKIPGVIDSMTTQIKGGESNAN